MGISSRNIPPAIYYWRFSPMARQNGRQGERSSSISGSRAAPDHNRPLWPGRNGAIMRSKLFVPGSRPEFFEKAWRSEADALSFDLEDAVVEAGKAEARARVAEAVAAAPAQRTKMLIVRANAVETPHFEADLEAVVGPGLDIVNLPKVESPDAVVQACRLIERLEQARGLKRRI